jgi:xanthine/uracil/vitamin C permease (AzgA family)
LVRAEVSSQKHPSFTQHMVAFLAIVTVDGSYNCKEGITLGLINC